MKCSVPVALSALLPGLVPSESAASSTVTDCASPAGKSFVTEMAKVWSACEPSAEAAWMVMLWLVGALGIEQRAVGDGDHAGVGVDGEPATGIVGQRVGDTIVGGVGVAGQGGDADRRAVGGVLGDGVGRARRCRSARRRRTRRRR